LYNIFLNIQILQYRKFNYHKYINLPGTILHSKRLYKLKKSSTVRTLTKVYHTPHHTSLLTVFKILIRHFFQHMSILDLFLSCMFFFFQHPIFFSFISFQPIQHSIIHSKTNTDRHWTFNPIHLYTFKQSSHTFFFSNSF